MSKKVHSYSARSLRGARPVLSEPSAQNNLTQLTRNRTERRSHAYAHAARSDSHAHSPPAHDRALPALLWASGLSLGSTSTSKHEHVATDATSSPAASAVASSRCRVRTGRHTFIWRCRCDAASPNRKVSDDNRRCLAEENGLAVVRGEFVAELARLAKIIHGLLIARDFCRVGTVANMLAH